MAVQRLAVCFTVRTVKAHYLATSLAHVRLFSSVYSHMDSESGSLDELLAATWEITSMWSNTAVNSFCKKLEKYYNSKRIGFRTMSRKIASSCEALLACTTGECLRDGLVLLSDGTKVVVNHGLSVVSGNIALRIKLVVMLRLPEIWHPRRLHMVRLVVSHAWCLAHGIGHAAFHLH